MAAVGRQVSVGTSAVDLLDAAGVGVPQGGIVVITNQGAASVFLGGSGVTSGTGYELKTNVTTPQLGITQNDQIWAVSASGTNRVDVLLLTPV